MSGRGIGEQRTGLWPIANKKNGRWTKKQESKRDRKERAGRIENKSDSRLMRVRLEPAVLAV